MAKPKVDRVAVVTGAAFFYEGVAFGVGQVVYMSQEQADDFVALRQVRLATPDEAKQAR